MKPLILNPRIRIYSQKAWKCLTYIYFNFKILWIAYLLLTILIVCIYPHELIQALTHSRSLVLFTIIRKDTLVALPLIVIFILIILKLTKYKFIQVQEVICSTIVLIVCSLLVSTLLEAIFAGVSPARLIFWSNTFMNADFKIFGAYPAFWLFAHLPFLFQVGIVYLYENFHLIISIWMVFLLIYKKGIYSKKFIIQFFMAFAVCFPLWILCPTISPAQMYIGNILNQPISPAISNVISIKPPNSFTDAHVEKVFREWTDPQSRFFATSNFPSMHTIWGIILAYSIGEVFKKRKITILAWIVALGNALGAIYLLPHYGVDILAGIVVAILIVKISTRYTKQNPQNVEVL